MDRGLPAAVAPRACFLLGGWSLPCLTSWVSTLPSRCLNQLFWTFWVELGFLGDGQAEIQVGDMSTRTQERHSTKMSLNATATQSSAEAGQVASPQMDRQGGGRAVSRAEPAPRGAPPGSHWPPRSVEEFILKVLLRLPPQVPTRTFHSLHVDSGRQDPPSSWPAPAAHSSSGFCDPSCLHPSPGDNF